MTIVTTPTSRDALIERAREMRARGLVYREIAAELGISAPYANELVRDPEGWRERRRMPPPASRQGDEVGLAQMARQVCNAVGFEVDSSRVQAAAREGKIPSRRGPRGRRLFDPVAVLNAIAAGSWRPHRPGGSEERLCGNPRCTRGPGGARQRRRVFRSQLERLHDETAPWTCSRECAAVVQRGRPRERGRTIPRPCGCEGCDRYVLVTPREVETDAGPKRCAECKRAARKTARQRASAQAAIVAASGAIDTEARNERARQLGERNRRSPDRMERLIEGRVLAQGAAFTDEMRKRVRSRAHKRARPSQAEATATLHTLVREYWPNESLTRDHIAGLCHVTPARISQIASELGLPARRRGRRRK